MGNFNFKSLFTLALCSLFSLSIFAQSTDDLYYTPSYNDYSAEEVNDYETASAIVEEDTYNDTDYSVSDSRFDNDFYYQSRLRRFCNPVSNNFSYYAPAYTNSYYYNNNPYAWSNNIYTQPVYSQRWWNPVNTYNVYSFGNNGYNYNRNYTSTYTSFGSTIYNNRYYNNPYYGGSVYNYNNTGGFNSPGSYYNPCTTTNYISNNSIDNYNENRIANRSSNSVRTTRSNTPRTPEANDANKTVRTLPSSTRSTRSATRTNTRTIENKSYSNTNSNNVRTDRKPKPIVQKNNDYTPKKERKNGIRNAFRNLGESIGNTSKSNNSSNRSYRSSSSSGSKSYSSGSSRGSSRSSGTSKRGGRR